MRTRAPFRGGRGGSRRARGGDFGRLVRAEVFLGQRPIFTQGGAVVARQIHSLEAAGSSPAPAPVSKNLWSLKSRRGWSAGTGAGRGNEAKARAEQGAPPFSKRCLGKERGPTAAATILAL